MRELPALVIGSLDIGHSETDMKKSSNTKNSLASWRADSRLRPSDSELKKEPK
jgi:hypothetical protein